MYLESLNLSYKTKKTRNKSRRYLGLSVDLYDKKNNVFMISNTHRNGLVVAGTLIGDWLLAMLTYWLFMSLFLDVTWDEMQLHTSVVVGVLYCACIINGGVILYLREVKRFQIVTKVTRNVLLFAVVAIPLLKFGHFRTMDYDMVHPLDCVSGL